MATDGGAQPSIGARTEREMGDGHESKNGEPSGREYTRYMYMHMYMHVGSVLSQVTDELS